MCTTTQLVLTLTEWSSTLHNCIHTVEQVLELASLPHIEGVGKADLSAIMKQDIKLCHNKVNIHAYMAPIFISKSGLLFVDCKLRSS